VKGIKMIKDNCLCCGELEYITEDNKLCIKCLNQTKILVVDIEFKDGSILSECVIFNNLAPGEMAIQDYEDIEKKFQKLPWYSRWDGHINFQNKFINGWFHVENVKSYVIRYIDK
jgi:hypothetical protein